MSHEPEASNAPEPAQQTDAAGNNAGQTGADAAAVETVMIPQIEIDARVAEASGSEPVENVPDDEPAGETRVMGAGAAAAAGAGAAAGAAGVGSVEDPSEETLQRSTAMRSELPKRGEVPKEANFLFVSKSRNFAPEPDAVVADPEAAAEADTEVGLQVPAAAPDASSEAGADAGSAAVSSGDAADDDEPLEETVVGVGPFVVHEPAQAGAAQAGGAGSGYGQPDYAQPVPAEGKPLSTGTKVAAAVAGGFVIAAFGGWAAAYAVAGDKIAEGTTVAGVNIGGMSADEATPLLNQKFAPAHNQPIDVVADGKTTEVNPADAGLELDAEATVEKAEATRSWSPVKLWKHFKGGGAVKPVINSDDKLVGAVAAKVNKGAGTPFKNGDVAIKSGKVKTTEPAAGKGVSDAALATALSGQLLADGDRKAEVPLTELTPDVDESDVKEAVDKVATPAVSGPITLKFEKTPVKLSPKEFGEAIRFDPKDGKLEASVAPKKLKKVLKKALSNDAARPVDATVKLINGTPKVVPAKPGVTFNQKDLEKVFLDVATADKADRSVDVKSKVAKPEVTTKEAKAWGVKEKISSYTTNFPYAEYRNVNIGRAADLVNGTVLKPGDTFSLNGIVGERTAANGFTKGWMIQDGVFREDYGGGVSQMATTTFNSMFFAGLQDVEHKPHSLYIDRYPIGREATVAWPSLDLKFKNDTKYGVLIHSWVNPAGSAGQGSVTVEMWSTKIWDIKTRTGERYDFKPSGKQKITDGNCENTAGAKGFSINVWRDFYSAGSGSKAKTETFKTVYSPQDEVTCTDETKKKPPADPN